MNSGNILSVLADNGLNQDLDYFNFHADRYNFLLEKMKAWYVPGNSFLEVGSYRGYLLIAASLMGYQVSGIDLAQHTQKIKSLCEKYHFDNRPVDLGTDGLPFPDNSFDLVTCSEVLEHLNFHPGKFFLEVSRVLRKGGRFIVTTPNLIRLNNVLKMVAGQSINAELQTDFSDGTHYREYNHREVAYLMETSGLSIEADFCLNFRYPGLGVGVKLTDALSSLLPSRKRDLCVIGIKK